MTQNEFVIMSGEAQVNVASCATPSSSESDNSGFTSAWVQDVTSSIEIGGVVCYWSAVGHTTYTHSGSLLVTFTFTISGTIAANVPEIAIQVYTITIPTPSITTSSGSGQCSSCTSLNIGVTAFSQENKVTVAAWMTSTSGSSPTYTAASGFTLYPTTGDPNSGSNRGFGVFNLSPSGPTTITNTISSGSGNIYSSMAAASYGSGTSSLPIGGPCPASATCTTIPGFNVTANSAIVLAVQSASATGDFVNTVTDSLGNLYTEWVAGVACSDFPTCANGNAVLNSIWTAPSSVPGTNDQITINFKNAITSGAYEVAVVANANPTPTCVVGAVSSSSVNLNTGTKCAFSAGSYLFSGLAGLASNTLTAGSGFTLIPSGLVNMQAQFDQITNVNPPNPAGNTVFPATISAATAVVDGGIVLASFASGGTGASTVGSCPTKNTGTTTLVNNTEYLWTGSYFNQGSISNLQTEIASVNSGHVSAETLYFGIYVTSGIGSVSANNPLTLQTQFSKSLTATATPQSLTWAAGNSYNLPTGATFAIALLGNNKFVINNSALTGAFSATTAGGVLAGSLTSITAGAANLYFCATFNFQTVVTTTIVSTATQSATTTVITTLTSLSTVLVNTSSPSQFTFWYIPLFFLLVFPGVYLAAGRLLKGR